MAPPAHPARLVCCPASPRCSRLPLLDRAATPRTAGSRGDGYGVRQRRCAPCCRIPRAERSCGPAQNNSPALRSGSNRFCEPETYAPLDMRPGARSSGAGPQDRPPRAPGLYSRRGPAVRGVAVRCRRACSGAPLLWLQSCAWAGCGASQAQAPAAGDTATQPGLRKRAQRACRAGRTSHARETCLNGAQRSELSRAGSRGRPAQGIR